MKETNVFVYVPIICTNTCIPVFLFNVHVQFSGTDTVGQNVFVLTIDLIIIFCNLLLLSLWF